MTKCSKVINYKGNSWNWLEKSVLSNGISLAFHDSTVTVNAECTENTYVYIYTKNVHDGLTQTGNILFYICVVDGLPIVNQTSKQENKSADDKPLFI